MLENKKWIITPHLFKYVKKFIAHLDVVKDEPIMIVGDTGVGKSLFLHIAEQYYIKNKNLEKNKLRWINCAHFGGLNSDPNIARSELFGHVKGSHSGAIVDKIGLVKTFEKDILILEEIGELPLSVQSILLTFVETGEFRRVGSTNIEKVTAKPQIIGATNREYELRPDFRYRFNPFYIPPLYERREDILYYWAYMFPELIKKFHGWEILTILAYNWPGNVREINRVGKLIERENLFRQRMPKPKKKYEIRELKWIEESNIVKIFDEVGYEYTKINPFEIPKLEGLLVAEASIDINKIENALNYYGVSIFVNDTSLPLDKVDSNKLELNLNIDNIINLNKYDRVGDLSRAYVGLVLFCRLFNQDEYGKNNVIDLTNWPEKEIPYNEYIETLNDIFQNDNYSIKSFVQFTKWISKLSKHKRRGEKLATNLNIFQMKHDELMRFYYKTLLELYDQNITDVARIVGKPYGTVHSTVTDKYKIRTKKMSGKNIT